MMSDDLLAAVFPDVAACQENIEGDIQIPDHPLVRGDEGCPDGSDGHRRAAPGARVDAEGAFVASAWTHLCRPSSLTRF